MQGQLHPRGTFRLLMAFSCAVTLSGCSLAPRASVTEDPTAGPTRPAAVQTSAAAPSTRPATIRPTAERALAPVTPAATPAATGGYEVYLNASSMPGQTYQFSCEFDAAWVILDSYGLTTTVDEIIARTPFDRRVEPYYKEKRGRFEIFGGDITGSYSGDYTSNFLARATGKAFVKLFQSYGLVAEPVGTRAELEETLRRGDLIWMKTTVDFQEGRPAVWITPEGVELPTVLGNDHAVVLIGFDEHVAVIRDVLGPTTSNFQRPYEYEVPWEQFMAAWRLQGFDALAIRRP